jgi:hypothetical protein
MQIKATQYVSFYIDLLQFDLTTLLCIAKKAWKIMRLI